MPDVASKATPRSSSLLDWVGMSEIELPVILPQVDGTPIRVSAKAQAYVNLIDPTAKGIHMSRLYLTLNKFMGDQALNRKSLRLVLEAFAESHNDLSNKTFVEFSFDYMQQSPSLKSDNIGWKGYPVIITGILDKGQVHHQLQVKIPYSSTCPCSAALARQLIQQKFLADFSDQSTLSADQIHEWLGTEEAILATPHSQRSYADVKVKIQGDCTEFPISQLIEQIESALKTPVQAVVKREDEQEFALLNGQNLMFCEDASRRIKDCLDKTDDYGDYWIRVDHIESLHPHNAISIVTKGIDDGYKPIP
ncbi:MAG: GTP cyclohydrolase I FolE2 [Gammaproteobacteria bacterium]|nr:GTP cyclohydrolase I FolE2 [Gammaproteobacteria bacterium]